MGCLLESGMMDALDRSSFLELQDQIKSLILATDIARQQEFLVAFQVFYHGQYTAGCRLTFECFKGTPEKQFLRHEAERSSPFCAANSFEMRRHQ